MCLPLPDWLDTVPPERRADARKRFLLRVAALYACEEGNMSNMSELIGMATSSVAALSKNKQPISINMVLKMESLLGEHIMPRQLMRPDIFNKQG